MKPKKTRRLITVSVLAAAAALLFGTYAVCADGPLIREINGGKQLVRELSQNWEDEYTADDGASRCQTKQIIVFARQMDDYCGAEKVLHYDEIDTYYLQFATETDTWNAYKQLRRLYGSNCMLDEVIQVADLQQSGVSWGAEYTGLDQLKVKPSIGVLGNTVTVAVIDTGINPGHELFAGRRISSASRNLVENNDNISDLTGHGTHVAGILADCTPAQVEVMAIRICDNKGMSSAAMLQAGILYAIQNGADVINLSLGDTNHRLNDNWLDACITSAYKKGIPIVCAAGNSKRDVNTCYPACDATTIAVSAIDQTGAFANSFSSTEGSNFGDSIDFAAPGVGIVSASNINNYERLSKSGTSMAAPFVSAAAAYVKMALPDASVDQVKSILRNYAVDYGTPGKDKYYGYGVIRMEDLQIDISSRIGLSLMQSSMTFNGESCCPGVLVTGIPFGQYTVSYANNMGPGTGIVTVTANGVYRGSVSRSFEIRPAENTGNDSTIQAVPIIPDIPQITEVKCVAKGIQIKWQVQNGAQSYTVYRKVDKAGWKAIKTLDGSVDNYVDTGVSAGKKYRYRLRAAGGGTTTGYSAEKELVFVKAASLSQISNGDKGVFLKWKKVSGSTGYYIYRKAATQTTWQYLKSVSASAVKYTDTKAAQGQQYSYQIRPYRKISGKKYTGAAANSKSIICMKKMAAPTLNNLKGKAMVIRWKKTAGTDGYQLRWSMKKNMGSAKNITVTNPQQLSVTLNNLKKNKTYYVQVRSVKRHDAGTAYGAWSSTKSVKIRK